MIRRRNRTLRLPSGLSRRRSSSQCPYSAWSVSKRVAALRETPRGTYTSQNSYSGIASIVRDQAPYG